jgi:aspartate/methionine/tyrosine aminotransferase
MLRESRRMQRVQTPVIPVVADLIRRHPGTISLGQGVVGYGPPPEALAAIERFLADPENHKYKPVTGLPELVEAFAKKLREENGIVPGEDGHFVITAGGNMAFMNAVLAVADPDDEVILQTPYYFNHEMAVTMADCRPVLVPTDAQYQLQPDAIRAAITPRTRAVVTISPNNPTGAVYPEAALRAVNALCAERGLWHIHDEAYEQFVYDGAGRFSPGSIPGAGAHTISLFSLSKSHGFASWRIGGMVVPSSLLGAVRKIQDTILICAPVISQFAALGALRADAAWRRERLAEVTAVREFVRAELAGLAGWCDVPRADGAFYFLLRVHTELRPMELTERLIREHGVAVIPGSAFGLEQGCHLRVAYGALSRDTAAAGIGRLVRGLRQMLKG